MDTKLIILLLLTSIIVGFYIHYADKDLSKNNGFILHSKGFINPFMHILIGMIIGFLIYPNKYSGNWENHDNSDEMNIKVWSRQIIGLIIFAIFTIRNFIKHPVNLKKHMVKCGMEKDYSIFLSSVTRQQTQLLIGICISLLMVNSFNKTEYKSNNKSSYIFNFIAGVTILQYILQLYMTRGNYSDLKYQFIKCNRNESYYYNRK
jgi:hypothetical protein